MRRPPGPRSSGPPTWPPPSTPPGPSCGPRRASWPGCGPSGARRPVEAQLQVPYRDTAADRSRLAARGAAPPGAGHPGTRTGRRPARAAAAGQLPPGHLQRPRRGAVSEVVACGLGGPGLPPAGRTGRSTAGPTLPLPYPPASGRRASGHWVDLLVARLADHPDAIVGRFPGSPHAVTALLAGAGPAAPASAGAPGTPIRRTAGWWPPPRRCGPGEPQGQALRRPRRRRRRARRPPRRDVRHEGVRPQTTSPGSISGSKPRARAARPSTRRPSRRGRWPSRSPAPGSRPSGSTIPAATSCATAAPSWPSRRPPPARPGRGSTSTTSGRLQPLVPLRRRAVGDVLRPGRDVPGRRTGGGQMTAADAASSAGRPGWPASGGRRRPSSSPAAPAGALPVLEAADANELAQALADATEDQDVCYGWEVTVYDYGGSGDGIDEGSSLGVGPHAPTPPSAPGGSSSRRRSPTPARRRSRRTRPASPSARTSPAPRRRRDLRDNGDHEGALLGNNDDQAVANATLLLPALMAEKGLAEPISLEAQHAAAARRRQGHRHAGLRLAPQVRRRRGRRRPGLRRRARLGGVDLLPGAPLRRRTRPEHQRGGGAVDFLNDLAFDLLAGLAYGALGLVLLALGYWRHRPAHPGPAQRPDLPGPQLERRRGGGLGARGHRHHQRDGDHHVPRRPRQRAGLLRRLRAARHRPPGHLVPRRRQVHPRRPGRDRLRTRSATRPWS